MERKTIGQILKEHTGHAHGLMDHTVLKAMQAYADQEVQLAVRNIIDELEKRKNYYKRDSLSKNEEDVVFDKIEEVKCCINTIEKLKLIWIKKS